MSNNIAAKLYSLVKNTLILNLLINFTKCYISNKLNNSQYSKNQRKFTKLKHF